eukprot:CAMPEP_0119482370 /NCGR_PEP_ID=MMETSP1344-20130328/10253_1 /TAXON_ID=236787 /ORGANISM="Florenciella parvula, Strain CCMP2471" /LENGTH=123 /DNA_ID=CAMNT_0007516759 /DNA_START=361 /DNA_END=733 /DNA_ORIENTATION=-
MGAEVWDARRRVSNLLASAGASASDASAASSATSCISKDDSLGCKLRPEPALGYFLLCIPHPIAKRLPGQWALNVRPPCALPPNAPRYDREGSPIIESHLSSKVLLQMTHDPVWYAIAVRYVL